MERSVNLSMNLSVKLSGGRTDLRKALEAKNLPFLKWMNVTQGWVPSQSEALVSVKVGDIDTLKWLFSKGIVPTIEMANMAAGNPDPAILNLLIDMKLYPDSRGADFAIEVGLIDGKFERVKWLISLHIYPTTQGANIAAEAGQISFLDYLAALEPPILPDVDGANMAAGADTTALIWLDTKGIYPDSRGLDIAAATGHGEILDFITDLNHTLEISEQGLIKAVENHHYHILEWVIRKTPQAITQNVVNAIYANGPDFLSNLLPALLLSSVLPPETSPTVDCANTAAGKNRLDVIQWLIEKYQLFPDEIGADLAIINGCQEVVKFLWEKHIFPTQVGMDHAYINGFLDLLPGNYKPSKQSINQAIEQGQIKSLQSSLRPETQFPLGFLWPPELSSINRAAGNGHLDLLKWLYSVNPEFLPTVDGADLAASNGHLDVLDWLKTFGITHSIVGKKGAEKNGYLDVLEKYP